jgi:hypothetical protein
LSVKEERMTLLTTRPELVFVDGDMVQVDHPCPGCGEGHASMIRSEFDEFDELEKEDRFTADLLHDCIDCTAGYFAAEKAWDDAAELAHERLRDWQAERSHGGY